MRARWRSRERTGSTEVIFGDLYLEDVRAYREQMLAGHRDRPACSRSGGARPTRSPVRWWRRASAR